MFLNCLGRVSVPRIGEFQITNVQIGRLRMA